MIVQQVSKTATEWAMFAEGELPLVERKGEGKVCVVPLADAGEISDLMVKLLCDGLGVRDFYKAPEILSDNFDPDELREKIYEYLQTKLYGVFIKK